jgi:hypothetical protein
MIHGAMIPYPEQGMPQMIIGLSDEAGQPLRVDVLCDFVGILGRPRQSAQKVAQVVMVFCEKPGDRMAGVVFSCLQGWGVRRLRRFGILLQEDVPESCAAPLVIRLLKAHRKYCAATI